MAVYEYECTVCEHRFDLRRGMTDDAPDPACPACGSSRARRVFSIFATAGSSAVAGSSGVGGCACGGACACAG
jgi:putative FmdB family regulatory protein